MRDLDTVDGMPRGNSILGACTLAMLIILAVRLVLVATYATSAPFWDQWDAEVDHLYRPFLDGSLHFTDLFRPHNEHRIFFTRVFALALFELNSGEFDARVQCFFNVAVFCVSLGVFLREVARDMAPGVLTLFLAMTTLVFASPIGWENLIAGFQNQFYVLMGFSVAAIAAAARARDNWRSCTLLFVLSLCAVFSMASGLLVAAVVAALVIVRRLNGTLLPRTTSIIAGSQLLLAATAYANVPKVAYVEQFKAVGIGDLTRALIVGLSWPAVGKWYYALVLWTPSLLGLILAVRQVIQRKPLAPMAYVQLGIMAWVFLQAVALAYSRGHDMTGIASRYSDLLALGLLTNLAICLRGAVAVAGRAGTMARVGAGLYMLLAVASFARIYRTSVMEMEFRSMVENEQVTMMRHYLTTHDSAAFRAWRLPYPDAGRVAATLDDPAVAGFMPPDIRRPLTLAWPSCPGVVPSGVPQATPKLGDRDPMMGSYAPGAGDRGLGDCQGPSITTPMPYLYFRLAGTPGPESTYLSLTTPDGRVRRLSPTVGDDTWAGVVVKMHGPEVVRLHDGSPTGWVATSNPVEVGELSAWVMRFSADGTGFMLRYTLVGMAILCILLLWRPRAVSGA